MSNLHRPIVLLAAMLLSACAQFTPYRPIPVAVKNPADYAPFKCRVDERLPEMLDKTQPNKPLGLCEDPKSAGSQAIQHRYYQAKHQPKVKGAEGARMPGNYHLSFVEFDDQGWFADRGQMEALFGLLKRLETQNNGSTLIYVYAHGWKHNASACDNNVVCFSRLLERTDLMQRVQATMLDLENPPPPRNVVGVYIGWRGLPFESVLNNASFWSRKDAAARVGRGGVFELLTRLKDYRDNSRERTNKQQNAKNDVGSQTQLVITGHSFGGLVIYSALSHSLMERAAKTTTDDQGTRYDDAKSFGDFVMLVNPAFEGSMYEPLFNIAANRSYSPKQKPVMMIVTSEADNATRLAFPAGQYVGTLLQHAKSPEQKASMHNTIGHNDRYLTHRLKSDGCKAKEIDDKSACPCKFLKPTLDGDVETMLLPVYQTMLNNQLKSILGVSSEPSMKPYGEKVLLTPDPWDCSIEDGTFQSCFDRPGQSTLKPKYADRYPYLVVSTDAGVIADHNAIYNERFTDFTMAFMAEHITAGSQPWTPALARNKEDWAASNETMSGDALVPSQRSCQLASGASCTVP